MAKKSYDERKVLNQLARRGINVNIVTKCIDIPIDGVVIIGIHTWGKIDYLVNYCGYHTMKVSASEAQKLRAAERAAKREERRRAKEQNNKHK